MLDSFFQNIPKDPHESAKVDGCTPFHAFRHLIFPVLRPAVNTAGLFSVLPAYNGVSVISMLLSASSRGLVRETAAFLDATCAEGTAMFGASAMVSATRPLFILVTIFRRQIGRGLTAGAVKG